MSKKPPQSLQALINFFVLLVAYHLLFFTKLYYLLRTVTHSLQISYFYKKIICVMSIYKIDIVHGSDMINLYYFFISRKN